MASAVAPLALLPLSATITLLGRRKSLIKALAECPPCLTQAAAHLTKPGKKKDAQRVRVVSVHNYAPFHSRNKKSQVTDYVAEQLKVIPVHDVLLSEKKNDSARIGSDADGD